MSPGNQWVGLATIPDEQTGRAGPTPTRYYIYNTRKTMIDLNSIQPQTDLAAIYERAEWQTAARQVVSECEATL